MIATRATSKHERLVDSFLSIVVAMSAYESVWDSDSLHTGDSLAASILNLTGEYSSDDEVLNGILFDSSSSSDEEGADPVQYVRWLANLRPERPDGTVVLAGHITAASVRGEGIKAAAEVQAEAIKAAAEEKAKSYELIALTRYEVEMARVQAEKQRALVEKQRVDM